jgi:hypothetical protein
LAVEQPTKFEFVVNLKTAKVLGVMATIFEEGSMSFTMDLRACRPTSKPSSRKTSTTGSVSASPRMPRPSSFGGNGLRAIGIIQSLEETLTRPVLTANQVAFWQSLVLSGSSVPIGGYGRIFSIGRPTSQA